MWDDIKPLPFSVRLIVQIFASWLVITLADVHIVNLGNLLGFGNIYLSQLGIPITIFMVVGVCNAFNMLDGMDGLLGTVVLVTVTSLSYMAYLSGFSHSFLRIIHRIFSWCDRNKTFLDLLIIFNGKFDNVRIEN